MFVRAYAVSVALLVSIGQAAALEPAELRGEWETQWSNAANEPLSGGGPLLIRLDSGEAALDGVIPAAGMDGVMNGEITHDKSGALIWSGTWVSYWPEGATTGAFRLVFTDADSFTGTWSSDDGAVADAAWNGQRAR